MLRLEPGRPRQSSRGEEAGALAGAAFLMATSAIGPGFLTQTAFFTGSIRTSFAFAILASVLVTLVYSYVLYQRELNAS